jgi:glycosyltransferase involved in cell wall biosynthesis
MTRGLPVVASAWGATPEVVQDAARLVDPRDPHKATEAILEFLSTKDRSSLAVTARRAANRYDWNQTALQTRRVYQRLAG